MKKMRRRKFKSLIAFALLLTMTFANTAITSLAAEVQTEETFDETEQISSRASLSRVTVDSKNSEDDGVANASVKFTLNDYIGFTKKLIITTTPKSTRTPTGLIHAYVTNPDGSLRELIHLNPSDDVTREYTLPKAGTYTLNISSTCNVPVEVAVGWID